MRDPQEEKNSAVAEYANWNVRRHDVDQRYGEANCMGIFNLFPEVERIDITRKACSLTSEFLLDSWGDGNDDNNFKIAHGEIQSLLCALSGSPSVHLKHLSHDELPVTFAQDFADIKNICMPLHHLESLQLTFDATICPKLRF
jgi:hypothetical protein